MQLTVTHLRYAMNKATFCICRVRSNHAVPVYVQYRTGIHTHCIIENKIYKNYVIFMLDTL